MSPIISARSGLAARAYGWTGTVIPVPSGDTAIVAGGGVAAGSTNVIQWFSLASTGNATDFGDLTVTRQALAGCSSSTRGVFGGHQSATTNTIDYVTILTTGNATDFGDLTQARGSLAACSSSTRGIFACGDLGTFPTYSDRIDYITIATTGNATTFGTYTGGKSLYLAGCASSTRGVFGANLWWSGSSFLRLEDMYYVTIATTGNTTYFGICSNRYLYGACSSSTRGVWGGGDASSGIVNTIDYITIATTGNSVNFGNLTVARRTLPGTSSATRGVFCGGNDGSLRNEIDYITIATTGNATDFGDLLSATSDSGACSNAHGGL